MSPTRIFFENPQMVKTGIVLLAVILSAIAIRGTVSLAARYTRLSGLIESLSNKPSAKVKHYEDSLFTEIDLDRAILERYGRSALENNVVIRGLAPAVLAKGKDFTIVTKEIMLEADFVGLLKCIRDCQNDVGAIKIASMRFEATTNSRKRTLQARVYVQHVQVETNH